MTARGRRGQATYDARPTDVDRPSRWPLAALCLMVGATAVAGGLALVARPDGSLIQLPPSVLAHTPFADFWIPGVLLAGVIGIGNLIAGVLVFARRPISSEAAFVGGAALMTWIVAQIMFLRTVDGLHVVYLIAAIAIMGEALRHRARHRAATSGEGTMPAGTAGMLMPQLSQYMTRQPWVIAPDATMTQAHHLMREHHIRHLPVIEAGKLVGVVSERDLHLIETLPDCDPDDVTVEDAMVTDVYVATGSDHVDGVVERMATHKYGSVVVVSDRGTVDGIFTSVDALQVLAEVLRRATA